MPSGPVLDLRRFRAARPPVVVLGGLNVTRAAGLAGIPVIVASAEPDCPAFSSRYCRGGVLLPPLAQLDAVAGKLVRLGEELREALGCAVPIFYGDDDYLNVLLRNREPLAPYYRFIVNDPDVAAALIDKERFVALTRSRGLPVPRSLGWDELERFAGPVLAKPKLKIAYDESVAYRPLFGSAGKARVFASGAELLANPLAGALRGQLLLQEYVPGSDRDIWSFHGYADEGSRLLTWFTGRKLRTYPAHTGQSSYLELTRNEELEALGRDIAARTPLKGVFKIDFKRNAQEGRFYMLEVNARFNLWHYLAAANGLSVPRVAYAYLCEGRRPPLPPRYRTSVRWTSFGLDWLAYRQLSARGELGFWRWARSLASRKVHQTFAWGDPLPFVMHYLRRLPRLGAGTP